MTDLTEKTLATERKYTGKIISVDLLDIELPDGRKAKREVIRHGNAVAILARRPDGKFVFVKQLPFCPKMPCFMLLKSSPGSFTYGPFSLKASSRAFILSQDSYS